MVLIGLGLNAIRTGSAPGRIGMVRRAESPLGFWIRLALYLGLGILALCYAGRGD